MAARQNRELCRFFASPNGCWYGDTCRFEHVLPFDMYSSWYSTDHHLRRGAPQKGFVVGPPPPQYVSDVEEHHWFVDHRPCKYFNTPSGCRFGDSCLFIHESAQLSGQHRRRNDLNNNKNLKQNARKVKINEIKCGECGKMMKSSEIKTAKMSLTDHYMEKLAGCDDKHIQYFLAEADFHLRDLICFACGRKFEEIQDLFHHFFRQLKSKSKKKAKHQDQLARIAKPYVERDWGKTIQQNSVNTESQDSANDGFTMQLLRCMVRQKDLQGQSTEEKSMMQSLARLSRTSESSIGAGSNGGKNTAGDNGEDSDGDSLDPELEDELEERAQNYGFTQDELQVLLSHGIKPWEDSDVDPWDFLEQLQASGALSNGKLPVSSSVSSNGEPASSGDHPSQEVLNGASDEAAPEGGDGDATVAEKQAVNEKVVQNGDGKKDESLEVESEKNASTE